MSQLDETDEPTLVTLTVGGNDLLSAYGSRARRSLLDKIENDIADAYDFLLDTLRAKLPGGTFVIATVYDPSDRSGVIPGVYDATGPLPLDILDRFNAHVRALGAGTPRTLLADVHAHFLGHGVSAAESDRWYWRRSLIEPNAQGGKPGEERLARRAPRGRGDRVTPRRFLQGVRPFVPVDPPFVSVFQPLTARGGT